MVEFAMVAPFFFLLLFGIIEGGRFVFFYEMLNSATREGARYAIVHGANSDCPSGPPAPNSSPCDVPGDNVRRAVRDAAMGLAGVGDFESLEAYWCRADGPKPCTDPLDQLNNARGNPVTVRAVYRYSPVMPLLPPITISSESTLVINN